MDKKINGINAGAFKFLICGVFILLFSGAAFGDVYSLALNPSSDLRIELVYSCDTLIGYNLFVRQKPCMESVMLTEPTGHYAFRSLAANATNGYERRDLSGKPLSDLYSRYSIISSSPIYDCQFGRAFVLFIPLKIVYGNPSSPCGTVYIDVLRGFQVNIRTFDHKYGDPNWGRYQNNYFMIGALGWNTCEPPRYYHGFGSAYPFY